MDAKLVAPFITVVCGTTVYVGGRIIEKFIIDPVLDFRKTIADIGEALIFQANIYANPLRTPGSTLPQHYLECQQIIRRFASLLRARAHVVIWYRLFAFIGALPDRSCVEEASADLIGLSNSLCHEQASGIDNAKTADKIKASLRLYQEHDDKKVSI